MGTCSLHGQAVGRGRFVPVAPGWESAENAAAYADFCRRFPKYEETSRDLSGMLPIATSGLVVDLACGTGTTTGVILRDLPVGGRVVAVDASKAMLDVASASIDDPRVTWIRARAEELPAHLDRPADLVLCSSGLWQMDMPAVMGAVRQVLRPGGGFAFNIGREFIALPLTDEERNPVAPNLMQLMQAAAVLYHGLVPPVASARRPRELLTVGSVQAMLEGAGFDPQPAKIVEHIESHESLRAWLSIPIFTERRFSPLRYEERMEALSAAYERISSRGPSTTRWVVFVAGVAGGVT